MHFVHFPDGKQETNDWLLKGPMNSNSADQPVSSPPTPSFNHLSPLHHQATFRFPDIVCILPGNDRHLSPSNCGPASPPTLTAGSNHPLRQIQSTDVTKPAAKLKIIIETWERQILK